MINDLTARGIKPQIDGSVHDPTDPVGGLLFTVLHDRGIEADLARARTREGMAVAKAKDRLRGKQPKLSTKQETLLVQLWREGGHRTLELAGLFEVGRSTIYCAIQRAGSDPSSAATA